MGWPNFIKETKANKQIKENKKIQLSLSKIQ